MAKCLAGEGASVAVLARRKDKLEALAKDINDAGAGVVLMYRPSAAANKDKKTYTRVTAYVCLFSLSMCVY